MRFLSLLVSAFLFLILCPETHGQVRVTECSFVSAAGDYESVSGGYPSAWHHVDPAKGWFFAYSPHSVLGARWTLRHPGLGPKAVVEYSGGEGPTGRLLDYTSLIPVGYVVNDFKVVYAKEALFFSAAFASAMFGAVCGWVIVQRLIG